MTKGNFSKRTAKPAFTTDIRNYSVCDYQNGIQLVTTRMKTQRGALREYRECHLGTQRSIVTSRNFRCDRQSA
ncbi:Uncharacterized protein PBTT_05813 [Plasmodiophora brassicae]